MADKSNIPVTDGQPIPMADDFDTKFKARLREQYGIEEEPETFKEKKSRWQKADEELPQYQATLTALIQHIKERDAAVQSPPVKDANVVEDSDEALRQLAQRDPYEATQRLVKRMEKNIETRLNQQREETAYMSEAAVARREGLRRAHEVVTQNWPEAFDQNTELHKMGKSIFQKEMSQAEQQHPMAFLIATERAAGRLGLPPKTRRGSSTRRADVSSQNVSRDRVRPDDDDKGDKPLSSRQKQIASGLGVDEKTYKEAMKIRKSQAKKQDEE